MFNQVLLRLLNVNLNETIALFFRLNEGFATYISYKGVQSAEPNWDMEAAFLTGDLHDVLDLVIYFFSFQTTNPGWSNNVYK